MTAARGGICSRHDWSSGVCLTCHSLQCRYERDGRRCLQIAIGTEVRGVRKSPRYCAAHGYMLATGEKWKGRKWWNQAAREVLQ